MGSELGRRTPWQSVQRCAGDCGARVASACGLRRKLRRSSAAVATNREDPIARRKGGSRRWEHIEGKKSLRKYRGPSGEIGPGRGAKAGWLVAATAAQIL